MPVLQPHEYDISYFDGRKATLTHNAGYSSYERWYRMNGSISLGEFWKDYTARLTSTHNLQDKKVLEIGCAKGFVVQDLRDMGVDAWGLDVSEYAIGEADPSVQPYLIQGDARTALSQFKNKEFDVVFSLRVLTCFDDVDLPTLVSELNRIAKYQFHVIDESVGKKQGTSKYYNSKPLSEWLVYNWDKGTRLVYHENINRVLIK